jgi:hypothetical protein
MQLIGINGFKRSGKGETAAAAASLLGERYKVHEVGFADKVKLWAAMSLGLTGTDEQLIALMNEAKESWEMDVWTLSMVGGLVTQLSGREYLQHIGNRARHLFGEDFWVDQVLPPALGPYKRVVEKHNLNYRYPGVDVLLMADLRYENEAQRVIDLGGVVWEVLRPGITSDGHDSEQPLPRHMVSWQIVNDDGLDVLRERTAKAIAETTSC